ncbi:hypothetical protein BH20ACT2_BH20ACT2_03630 [soil metagenome]
MTHSKQNEGRLGDSDREQRTAPEGEGHDAPFLEDGGEHPEMSVFDGEGNEHVVVLAENEDGEVSEGTGPDRESALADAKKGDSRLGDAFSPGKH